MIWEIDFHPAFDPEYEELAEAVQDELLAQLKLLEQFGPRLGRPAWIRLTDHATPI